MDRSVRKAMNKWGGKHSNILNTVFIPTQKQRRKRSTIYRAHVQRSESEVRNISKAWEQVYKLKWATSSTGIELTKNKWFVKILAPQTKFFWAITNRFYCYFPNQINSFTVLNNNLKYRFFKKKKKGKTRKLKSITLWYIIFLHTTFIQNTTDKLWDTIYTIFLCFTCLKSMHENGILLKGDNKTASCND